MRSISRGILGLLLGATLLTPVTVQAQDRGDRWSRGTPSDSGQRPSAGNERSGREARMEARQAGARQMQAPQAQPRESRAAGAQFGGRADGVRQRQGEGNWNRGGDAQQRARADAAPRQQWQNNAGDRRDANRPDRNRPDWNRDNRNDRRDDRRVIQDRRADARQDWRSDNRNWNNNARRDWSRDWRNDRRYGWQDYRNRNSRIYRVPRYVAPRYGYDYRRWSPGYRIDPWFYGANYWISDPFYYRLPPAYDDYRWVRYYDDVALVDIRTGLIVDIIYSFFLR